MIHATTLPSPLWLLLVAPGMILGLAVVVGYLLDLTNRFRFPPEYKFLALTVPFAPLDDTAESFLQRIVKGIDEAEAIRQTPEAAQYRQIIEQIEQSHDPADLIRLRAFQIIFRRRVLGRRKD